MKKRILAISLIVAMLAIAVIGGSLAYFTDTDKAVNTFTVGKVDITLDETDVDLYGVKDGETRVKTNTYKLIPGHHYVKDPVIHLDPTSEPCYLYVEIDNQIEDIIVDGENKPPVALLPFTQISEQIAANDWGIVGNGIYGKLVTNPAEENEFKVFESFEIKPELDEAALKDYENKTIVINAYAVQKDGFKDEQEAWNSTFGAKP